MPRISYFYGISIYMYFDDHAPPHFHARYGEYEAKIAIESGAVLIGILPPRAMRLVRSWSSMNRVELSERWELASIGRPIEPVRPLK